MLSFIESPAAGAVTFSNRDLRGDYAFAAQSCCVVGRFSADGAGLIVGYHTPAGGNDVHHERSECTYAVNPDGTGTMTCNTEKLDGPDAGSMSFGGTSDFILVDRGREIFAINTNEEERWKGS